MPLTYRQLQTSMQLWTDAQLDSPIVVHLSEEGDYYTLREDFPIVESDGTDDTLERGQLTLCI